MSQSFAAALAVTGPTFLWVMAGVLIRRLGWLPDRWIAAIAQACFRYGIPVLLFLGASGADYSRLSEARYILVGIIATLLVVALAELWGRLRNMGRRDRGVFVQAAYRSNLGVVGLALCASTYGIDGLAMAALPVALLTILYNLIAVVVLGASHGDVFSWRGIALGIARNPLIIGIALGATVAISGIELPGPVALAGDWTSAIVLPLSVLCIGATLDLRALREQSAVTLDAVLWRVLLAPLLSTVLAIVWGINGMELGVLFLLLASPVAVASFVMVVAVGGNGTLAANIVVLTTLLSSVALTLGLALLKAGGWV